MTTLAQQLQKLAVPQTNLLSRDKKRASLLFDPKEAAGIDRDTFYDIGISGLKELIKLNPQFASFENSLFSPTSRQIERAVENVEINDKLNRNIKRFLLLLSPYLLLKPSQKALEWLIHRFSINEYNKDDCFMLIFPYHETNIFVKFFQLLNIKNESDRWHWLRDTQKGGIHLPKLTLFNHGSSNPNFLKFICDMTIESLKENGGRANTLTTLFSFFCTTIIGSLDRTPEITEPQISALLPTILRALSSNIPDFTASAYLIIAKLLKKAQLSLKILKQFTLKLTYPQVQMPQEAALLLTLIYQSQSVSVMPERVIDNLRGNDWFFKQISMLQNGGTYVLPVVKALVKTLLQGMQKEEARSVLERLIEDVRFEEGQAEEILIDILENTPDSKDLDLKCTEFFTKLLQRFELQYPSTFDRIIQSVMNGPNQKSRKSLSIYLNFLMKLPSQEENIFENLYHPNEKLRENATRFFVKNYPNLNEKERGILKSAIVDRLLDDSRIVIKAALQLKKRYLLQLLGETKLLDILTRLLDITYAKKYYDLSSMVISLLTTIKYLPSKKFMTFLPFLLPTNNDELSIALHLLKSDFHHPVLTALKSKSVDTHKSFCEGFYSALCKSPIEINEIIDSLEEKMAPIYQYLSIVLISCCLPKVCHPSLGIMALKHILGVSFTKVKTDQHVSPFAPEFLSIARNGAIPLQGVLICIEIILEKVLLEIPKGFVSFEAPDESLLFIKDLFVFLLNGCATQASHLYARTMQKFFQKCFPSPETKVTFLSNFLPLQDAFGITPQVQIRACRALSALIQKEKTPPLFTPALLIGCINPLPEMRQISIDIMKNLVMKQKGSALLKELYLRKEEILLDPDQLPLLLFTIKESGLCSSDLEALVRTAMDFTIPIHVLAPLSKALAFINPYEVAESYASLGLRVLEYVGNHEKVVDPFRSELLYNIILRLNSETAPLIKEESKLFDFLLKGLRYDLVSLSTTVEHSTVGVVPSILILEQIDKDVFSKLNPNIQRRLLETFCTVASQVENVEVVSSISKVVKRIEVDAALILGVLEKMRDAKSTLPTKKDGQNKVNDKRKRAIPTIDILDTPDWKEGVVLLEFLQNKKKLLNADRLLPLLFALLKRCLEFDEQGALEYTKQLLLSSILHCCSKVEAIPASSFNMELVVQCIRISQNPQTHHHALLLLSHCASLLPEQVLHNIMAIFTFMGSSVLRHDDAYSFQIISKIIDNVIPILTKDNRKETILSVIRVFVDVILDVPEHRRVPLFVKFLTTLGEEHLDLFLLLNFESHVFHNVKESPRLQCAQEILEQFKPDVVVLTSTRVVEFLKGLPEVVEDAKGLFNFTKYTPKRFRHFKYTLVTFISGVLSSKKLINAIAILNRTEMIKMEELYKNIIINVLTYIQSTTKLAEINANSPQAQYFKVMLHHCYDILDSINSLLTKEMFLLVIRGLIVHNITHLRRKALELLNNKLQHEIEYFGSEPDDLFALLPSLVEILRADSADELIQQTALLTIKLLTKHLAGDHHEKFVPILIFVSDLLKNKPKGNILASLILCLSELVFFLRAYAIAHLPKFMPPLLKLLKTQREANLLLICTITSLNKIIEALPLFLSPYLPKIVHEVSILSVLHGDEKNLHAKLVNIRNVIGTKVPIRVLVPIVSQCYRELCESENYVAVGGLMDILNESLIQSDFRLESDLESFFLCALDFRTKYTSEIDVEAKIVDTLTRVVLKLSETTFRPFYYKIYDWAIRGEVRTERVITFYRLSKQIASKLKGLFVLFAGHFLPNAVKILQECNKTSQSGELFFAAEEKSVTLLEYVLETLTTIFVHDGQSFVDKDRFELLMQPLVDQLENDLSNKELVLKCVSHFAISTADDTLWKQLNYQVLLKTRHDNPEVRLVALKCVKEVAAKIGEDFLPLLPETIPFLAELLEDENEEVEKCCQNVVRELETILGEPLQKYF